MVKTPLGEANSLAEDSTADTSPIATHLGETRPYWTNNSNVETKL